MVSILHTPEINSFSHKLTSLKEKERKALQDFRTALQSLENCEGPVDDEFLLRFLRMKNFDIPDCVRLYKKCVKYMDGTFKKEILSIPFEECLPGFEMNVFTVLKTKHDGSPLIWVRPRNWIISECRANAMFKILYYLIEELQKNPENQAGGIIALLDFGGLGMMKSAEIVAQFTVSLIKMLVGFGQGGAPFRLRGIYTANTPMFIVSSYTALIKYLLKPKIRDRIRPHYGDVIEFQRYVSEDNLPVCLGGKIPDDDPEDKELLQSIFSRNQSDRNRW